MLLCELFSPKTIGTFINEKAISEDVHLDLDLQRRAREIADAFGKWLASKNEDVPLKDIVGVKNIDIGTRDGLLRNSYIINAGKFSKYYDLFIGFSNNQGTGSTTDAMHAVATNGGHPAYYVLIMTQGDKGDDTDVLYGIKWDHLIHELIHYLDRRERVKGNNVKSVPTSKGGEAYYNSPLEFNAYFQQGLYHLLNEIMRLAPRNLERDLGSYEMFRARFRTHFELNFWRAMKPETRRRFDKRFYRLYVHLRDMFRELGHIDPVIIKAKEADPK